MPSNQPVTIEPQCPECRAVQVIGARKCWLCGAKLPSGVDADDSLAGNVIQNAPIELPSSFSLASLMMFMTLACVVLGVSTLAPGLGVPLGVVSLVVWLRTASFARQRRHRGMPMTRLEKMQFFLSTAGFLTVAFVLVGVAGAGALSTLCFTICAFGAPGDNVSFVPFALGAAAITVVAFMSLRWLFRHKSGPNVGE